MANENKGPGSGKLASNPARAADAEGGPNVSSKQPTHSAPPANDGRHGEKHGGHDLDSGQHSTSGSRRR